MEGSSGGSQKERRQISSVPPAAANLPKRRMPKGMLELPYGTQINYPTLLRTLKEQEYTDEDISKIRTAFVFAEHAYKGKKRKGGPPGKEKEDYIVHPTSVAIRAACLGLPSAAVCAALLHDAIEDTNGEAQVTPEKIEAIFLASKSAPVFAKRVSGLVVSLTKPRFSEGSEWVFANDQEYYRTKDRYSVALYDQRSDAYYQFLLNSGDLHAITLKLLDNLHNAENMTGIKDEQRQKNFRTMANKTLRLARLMLVEEDFRYFRSLFEQWGFTLPPTVEKAPPHGAVVEFPLRSRLNEEALLAHPDPSLAFISVYGSAFDSFKTGFVEVGLPPRLGINYLAALEKHLPEGLFCQQKKSMVPESFPTHEVIFRIYGFDFDRKARRAHPKKEPVQLPLPGFEDSEKSIRAPVQRRAGKNIQPSEQVPGFFDIFDNEGNFVISISEDALTLDHVFFGEGISAEFSKNKEKHEALKQALAKLYESVLRPELERQTTPPAPPNKGPSPS